MWFGRGTSKLSVLLFEVTQLHDQLLTRDTLLVDQLVPEEEEEEEEGMAQHEDNNDTQSLSYF